MRCKNCGSENEDNLYICQNCGSPLYDEDEPIKEENNTPEDEMGKTRVVPAVSSADIESTPHPASPGPQRPPVDDEDEEKKKKQQTAIIIALAVVLVVIIAVLAGVLIKSSSDKKETTTASTTESETVSQSTTAFTTRPTTESTTAPTTESTTQATTAQTYTIEVMCPDGGGSVRGSGEIEVNKEITVTASPDGGFKFDGWYENGKRVSTSENYTFTVVRNRTLIAKYSLIESDSTEAQ